METLADRRQARCPGSAQKPMSAGTKAVCVKFHNAFGKTSIDVRLVVSLVSGALVPCPQYLAWLKNGGDFGGRWLEVLHKKEGQLGEPRGIRRDGRNKSRTN